MLLIELQSFCCVYVRTKLKHNLQANRFKIKALKAPNALVTRPVIFNEITQENLKLTYMRDPAVYIDVTSNGFFSSS